MIFLSTSELKRIDAGNKARRAQSLRRAARNSNPQLAKVLNKKARALEAEALTLNTEAQEIDRADFWEGM